MRNFILGFLALILLPAYMSGQAIKGKVSDKNGVGIPGAIIVAVDSKSTTDTDFDGNFNINAKEGEVLKISMVGFDAVSVKASLLPMSVTLKDSKDIKLCVYLKMNLSSKEIAPMMNISFRGVELHRYRLRKKLNLIQDENLSKFLLSI